MAAKERVEEQPEDRPPMMETSDESDTPGAALNRAFRAKEYLSVRHALPKTNISNVILYENTSQERHLERQLSSLTLRMERHKNVLDLQKRAFAQKQTRKQNKWKREDEFNLNNMNLPVLDKKGEKRPHSMYIMYRNPDYHLKSSLHKSKLPPLTEIKREKTEIVIHKDRTFITRVPMSVSVNKGTLRRHLKYCGQKYLIKGKATQDERFQRLSLSLEPTFLRNNAHAETDMQHPRASLIVARRASSATVDRIHRNSVHIAVPVRKASTFLERQPPYPADSNASNTQEELTHSNQINLLGRKEILAEFKHGDIQKLFKKLSVAD